MSDDQDEPAPIFGTVENNRRVEVAFDSAYVGMAGVRLHSEGIAEVAYFAARPPKMPLAGTVQGVAAEVVDASRSDHATGMVVLTVKLAGELPPIEEATLPA